MGGAEGEAWVTLATNDSYALGALVLAHSLRRVGTTRRLVALVTPGVTMAMRDQLCGVFDLVEMVNVLDSGDAANLALLSRPDLGVTFTKLHCWRLTQFSKCVFLDADTLVLQSCDELFEREELSAAPDPGWPDCFNSGVFVYKPSNETYQQLIKLAVSQGSFDGGDQGLLNSFFSDWATRDISRHLPFIYNMCSTSTYSYLPAYKKFGENVRIVHFIGVSKPWMQSFDSETRQVRVGPGQDHQRMLLQIWWDIFCLHVHPHLSIDMAGLAAAFSQMVLGTPKTEQQIALEEHLRREAWETGQIDYLGKDSFENVWKKIMETLTSKPGSSLPPTPESAPPKSEITPQAAPPSTAAAELISVAPPPQQQPPPPSPQPEVAPISKSPPPTQPPVQDPEPPVATPPPSIPLSAAVPAAAVLQQKPVMEQKSVTQSPKESVAKTPASPKSPSPAEPSTPPPTSPKPTMPSQPTPPKAAAGGAKGAPVEQKEAAAKQASAKGSHPATGQAASEEGAKGPAPVAPKRKGGSGQQQGASGRGGKSGGQKGGKK